VWAWGSHCFGQLGLGATKDEYFSSPVKVASVPGSAESVAASGPNSFIISSMNFDT
jgi:hypothetical protein